MPSDPTPEPLLAASFAEALAIGREYCAAEALAIVVPRAGRSEIVHGVGIAESSVPEAKSFAHRAIAKRCGVMVPDALEDAHFREHPQVAGPPHWRSVVAEPIVPAGERPVGAVLALDRQVRPDLGDVAERLRRLALLLASMIDLRAEPQRAAEVEQGVPVPVLFALDELAQPDVEKLLTTLAGRWTLDILRAISSGPVRFNALLAALPGMNSRTLSDRLSQLQAFGFVRREQFAEVPTRVEYELTGSGRDLIQRLADLGKWFDGVPR